jgi:pimeloyl-ACP methyl ester carboxylesterase
MIAAPGRGPDRVVTTGVVHRRLPPEGPDMRATTDTTYGLLLLVLLAALAGCGNLGDRRQPIPTIVQPPPVEAARAPLVVVLPGRRDDAAGMARRGVADSIQAAWPQAEVVLTGATLDYYLDGGLPRRLHDEIIAPALAGGGRELWLVGISLGGMGALVYDRAYPDQVDGIILLGPFLGGRALLDEIQAAGGIAAWQPGPVPDRLDRDNALRELWRHLQGYVGDPGRGQRIWLAHGDRDRLRRAVPVIAPLLPAGQILERPGGHSWTVWRPALVEILESIQAKRAAAGEPVPARRAVPPPRTAAPAGDGVSAARR